LSPAYSVLHHTGPKLFDACLRKWQLENPDQSTLVTILPQKTFYPKDIVFSWRTFELDSDTFAVHYSAKTWVTHPIDTICVSILGSFYWTLAVSILILYVLFMMMNMLRKRHTVAAPIKQSLSTRPDSEQINRQDDVQYHSMIDKWKEFDIKTTWVDV